MSFFEEAAQDFLAQKRIAVAGVSRTETETANGIYRLLRDRGYEVFAVNPNADSVEGAPCYPNMQAIPDGVDGAILVTMPGDTAPPPGCLASGCTITPSRSLVCRMKPRPFATKTASPSSLAAAR